MQYAFLMSALIACAAYGQDEPAKSEEKLYSMHLVEDGYDIAFTEIERGENYSVAKVVLKKGTSVGSSMTLVKCFYDIAVERGFRFFTNSKEWSEEGDDEAYYIKVFFTNNRRTPLKKLLGDDYSKEVQEIHDEVGYLSVREFRILFGSEDEKPQGKDDPNAEDDGNAERGDDDTGGTHVPY